MKNLFSYFFLFTGLLLIVGCLQYKEVEVVKVTEVGLKKIALTGIDIEVAMQIKNPNNYDISIVDSDLTLFGEGEKIGVARVKEKITLKKKSNKIYRFTVHTSSSDIFSSAVPLLMSYLGKDSLVLKVEGSLKARAKGLSKRFPVNFEERIKI